MRFVILSVFLITILNFNISKSDELDCSKFQKEFKKRIKCLTQPLSDGKKIKEKLKNKLDNAQKKYDELNKVKTLSDLSKQ